ncbi:MAG: TerC family protein [Candidatus Eisenbacteria bacterium]
MANPVVGWTVFVLLVGVLLAIDLLVYHRRPHAISLREALLGSALWVSLALLFNLGVFLARGSQAGFEFLTGYLIELSLSVDNLFVFLLIFRYFSVPSALEHRVLFWGVMGAVVMRLIFIFAGVALLERFHWLIYLFGAILIFSGIKIASHDGPEIHPERNPVLRLLRRLFPVTPGYEGSRFTVFRDGRRMVTPLLMVLVMVETTDLVFAVDSIPAVLAITRDPFIVITSNVFAVLGLRALFFSIAGLMRIFHYLPYGLSAILVFVGAKMMLSDLFHLPIAVALGVVGGILALSIVASILHPRPVKPDSPSTEPKEVPGSRSRPTP